MDGGFDVGAVKVCVGAVGGVDELGGEGEDVPEEGALLIHFVDVEAGVVGQGGIVDQIEDIAVGFAGEVEEFGRLVARRREGEVFFAEIGEAAGLVETVELGHEGLVELEEGFVLHDKWDGGHLFLRVVKLADARVVDQSSCRRA